MSTPRDRLRVIEGGKGKPQPASTDWYVVAFWFACGAGLTVLYLTFFMWLFGVGDVP